MKLSLMAVWIVSLGLEASATAQMSVALSPSVFSPQPLGTHVLWSATVYFEAEGPIFYRFRTRPIGGSFRTVVDFGPKSTFDWSTISGEGVYEIEVTARNTTTGASSSNTASYRLEPIAKVGNAIITATPNPLVFIYSVPPCPSGQRMRVEFGNGQAPPVQTPYKACRAGMSMNFYLAQMRQNTIYIAHSITDNGTSTTIGPDQAFFSGYLPLMPPTASLLTAGAAPTTDGVLLQSLFGTAAIATDLSGNVLWFSPGDVTFLTRPDAGGTFLGIIENEFGDPSQQAIREFDLAGVTLAETNAARVNEQLVERGVHPINAFHHEARRLPDGGYLVLANSERLLTDVQGPGPVDVVGDTILILDSQLQVKWVWDSFDHLDPHRAAVLGETCAHPSGLACSPWYLSPVANDWLHGNSLQLTPDGDILYSVRHQDWVIKIDYSNGLGTNNIVWRLGSGGDFQTTSTDPSPWFSHQHDPNFQVDDSTLTLFDDGNGRALSDPNTQSRGQVWNIQEATRTASPLLNANLGSYSPAVGSAQRLPNGDYHFDSGFLLDPAGNGNRVSQSVEVNPAGQIVYAIQLGAMEYRSFRMANLYTAP